MCVPVCSCSILVQAGRVPPPPIPHSQGRERCAHQGHHRRRGRVQGLPQWHRGFLQSARSAGRAIAGRVCCAKVKDPSKITWQPAAPHTATHCTQCTCITYCMRLKLLSFALPNHRPDSTQLMVRPTSSQRQQDHQGAASHIHGSAHCVLWEAFFSIYPAAVEDILEERLLPVRTDALPPCSTQLALSSFARHQVRYAQTKHLCMHAHVCTLW